MKKYFLICGIPLILGLILHLIIYGVTFELHSVSDVLFIVGLSMLFITVITTSGANRVFITLGYSIKSAFRGKNKEYDNLYDYTEAKDRKKETKKQVIQMLVSVISTLISLIIRYISI